MNFEKALEVIEKAVQFASDPMVDVNGKRVNALTKVNNALRIVIATYFVQQKYGEIVALSACVGALMRAKSLALAPQVVVDILEAMTTMKFLAVHGEEDAIAVVGDSWCEEYESVVRAMYNYCMERNLWNEFRAVAQASFDNFLALRNVKALKPEDREKFDDLLLILVPLYLSVTNMQNWYQNSSFLDVLNEICARKKLSVPPPALKAYARLMLISNYRQSTAYMHLWCCVLSDLYVALESKTCVVPALVYFPDSASLIQQILDGAPDNTLSSLAYGKTPYERCLIDMITALIEKRKAN